MNYLGKILLVAQAAAKQATRNVKYKRTFSASEWTHSDSGDTLSVAATTHKRGADIIVDVWMKSGTNYVKSNNFPNTGWSVSVNSSGNVTITTESGSAFAGKVVIT